MAINGLRRGLLLLLVVALMAIIPVTAFAQTEGDVKRAEDQVDRAAACDIDPAPYQLLGREIASHDVE